MFNRKEYRKKIVPADNADLRREKNLRLSAKSAGNCIGFVFFFFFFIQISFGNTQATDTTKTKKEFDINDPRNPDCPCHKYQLLADNEYKNSPADNTDLRRNDLSYQRTSAKLAGNKSFSHKLNTNRKAHKVLRKGRKENYLRKVNKWLCKTKNALAFNTSKPKKNKYCLDKCFLW